jgi:malonyl-CoA O-methyltransferase
MPLDKQLLARRFGRAATTYLRHARVQERAAAGLLRAILLRRTWSRSRPGRLLDVGCGTGLFTELLLEAFPGAAGVALDLSPGMIDQARRRLSGRAVDFTVGDIEVGFPEGVFDVVASSMALHWTLDPAAVLRAAADRLAPDGLLAVAVPVEGTLAELRGAYSAAAEALRLRLRPGREPGPIAWRHPMLAFHAAARWEGWARAAFDDVALEEEHVVERHRDPRAALEAIRGVGANDCGGGAGPAAVRLLRRALDEYAVRFSGAGGTVAATWRIALLTARGPRREP